MKLPLLLCALFFSVQGKCASAMPSQLPAQAASPDHQIIGWMVLAYFIALSWWVVSAKHSLDKILQDVLQDIDQYA